MDDKKTYGTVSCKETDQTKTRKWIPSWYYKESKHVLKLAWPIAVTQFLQYLIFPISTAFVGQTLGTVELDAVSLASTILNITGLAIGCGMATACDALFSQAFGSENHKKIGYILQRGLILMALACIPCWAIQLNTETIVILLGQEPDIAYYTGRVCLFFMPGLMANFLFQMLAKYLQNQDIVIPVVITGIAANIVNALSHYVLLVVMKTGVEGSAISQALAHCTLLFGTIIYILVSGVHKKTWSGWSREAFRDWGEFVKYAAPGSMMLFLDFFCFEAGVFLSGLLGKEKLAAMSIAHQISALVYMIPLGISIACSIRVGQKLGANNATGAIRTIKSSISLAFVCATIICAVIVSLSGEFPKLFSADDEVISITASIAPPIGVYAFFDAIGGTFNGALRGCGYHLIGAGTIFIGYYFIGLATGVSLMFLTSLELLGYWLGMIAGTGVNALLLFIISWKFVNWSKEATRAHSGNEKLQMNDEKSPLLDSDSCDTTSKTTIANIEANVSFRVQDTKYLLLTRLSAVFLIFCILGIGLVLNLTIQLNDITENHTQNITAINMMI